MLHFIKNFRATLPVMDGHYTISKATKHDKTLIYFIGVTRRASFNYFLTRLHLFDKLLNYDHVR